MTGTARGPEKRTRRAIHDFEESAAGAVTGASTGRRVEGGDGRGGAQAGGAGADIGSAQSLLRGLVDRTAYDVKELHRELRELEAGDLRRIPILAEGATLERGSTYMDLQDADRRELKARGHERVGRDNWIVPKAQVDYELWNRLRRNGRGDVRQ